MTEQSQENQQEKPEEARGQQSQQGEQAQQSSEGNEPRIPKHRLDEESRKRREAEEKLERYEQEQQQREESAQQEQGQYKELAEKRQAKIENLEAENRQLKDSITRDKRYRAFTRAAQGVIIPEAVEDAFEMLSEDDFGGADTTDENSYRMLAQQLAERKPFMADGPAGAGSGGSSRPVASSNGRGRTAPTIAELNSQKRRKNFK